MRERTGKWQWRIQDFPKRNANPRRVANLLLPPANEVWGKVICLQVDVCPRVLGPGGCLVLGGVWSGGVWSRAVWSWGVWSQEEGLLVRRVPGGDPPDGYCCGRQYAFYWNAFLFGIIFLWKTARKKKKRRDGGVTRTPLDQPLRSSKKI